MVSSVSDTYRMNRIRFLLNLEYLEMVRAHARAARARARDGRACARGVVKALDFTQNFFLMFENTSSMFRS